jgi:hypothetical protein
MYNGKIPRYPHTSGYLYMVMVDTDSWGENCANKCDCGIGADYCDRLTGCMCNQGYNGTYCTQNINECLGSPSPCINNQKCVDTEGSYHCTCETGYLVHRHSEKKVDATIFCSKSSWLLNENFRPAKLITYMVYTMYIGIYTKNNIHVLGGGILFWFLCARLETGRIMWLGMAGGRPHRFPHNNFSSVYRAKDDYQGCHDISQHLYEFPWVNYENKKMLCTLCVKFPDLSDGMACSFVSVSTSFHKPSLKCHD